jgi:hypothetical protein
MRNAYAMNNDTEAKAALEKIFRQLERINPMAARSLGGRTGRDANGTSLRYRSGVAAKTRDHQPDRIVFVDGSAGGTKRKRWREGNQSLRWTAAGLLEAEKKFRRIKGYQELLLWKERLNPSRLPQKEVRTTEVA